MYCKLKVGNKTAVIVITDDKVSTETFINERDRTILMTQGYDNFNSVINETKSTSGAGTGLLEWRSF